MAVSRLLSLAAVSRACFCSNTTTGESGEYTVFFLIAVSFFGSWETTVRTGRNLDFGKKEAGDK